MNKELKIGLVALTALVCAYLGLNYLKGAKVFSNDREYYAVYNEVSGLSADNQVTFNGNRIGSVQSVEFMEDRSGRLLVKFSIHEKNINVPEGTIARIVSLDLFGTKAIKIVPGSGRDEVPPGDTLLSGVEADLADELDRRFQPIEEKTSKLISSLDSVVTTVQYIFNEEAQVSIRESFVHINESMLALRDALNSVNDIVDSEQSHIKSIFNNLDSITANIKDQREVINNSMGNIEALTDSLAASNIKQTLDATNKAMTQIAEVTAKVNNGEGTVGQLLNNDSVYINLERATKEMEVLLNDMQENPNRYVHFSIFGRKEKN